VERRVGEHNDGIVDGYTKPRRPVVLVYAQGSNE
jgi:predicted GIY-YIG superfamily endonuclease